MIDKKRLTRQLRRGALFVLVLTVLAVCAGVGYVWYNDQQPVTTSPHTVSESSNGPPVIKHVTPAKNTPVGAAVQSLNTPAAPGSQVTLQIGTLPDATCTIMMQYGDVTKPAVPNSAFVPQKADEFGMVTWQWALPSNAPIGNAPVTVTCSLDKRSAVVQAPLVIARGS